MMGKVSNYFEYETNQTESNNSHLFSLEINSIASKQQSI